MPPQKHVFLFVFFMADWANINTLDSNQIMHTPVSIPNTRKHHVTSWPHGCFVLSKHDRTLKDAEMDAWVIRNQWNILLLTIQNISVFSHEPTCKCWKTEKEGILILRPSPNAEILYWHSLDDQKNLSKGRTHSILREWWYIYILLLCSTVTFLPACTKWEKQLLQVE